MNYWIITVSKEHAKLGIKGSFTQSCHGKKSPLSSINNGDKVILYSSKEKFGEKTPCQKFIAIGNSLEKEIYQVKMFEDFCPYRKDVDFYLQKEVEIKNLIPDLSFIKNKKSWGMYFRFGQIKIPESDFLVIEQKMKD